MMVKRCIRVSHEMLSFVGAGAVAADDWPADPVGLNFALADSTFAFRPAPTAAELADGDCVFVVAADACRRIFGRLPAAGACWHLPCELRALVVAILDCRLPGEARDTLRLAKSIELLCAAFERIDQGTLIAADGAGELSEMDTRRIVAARRLIDERWREKLTLDVIARACGINRAKLTRGFRSMYDMTVADAITEMRLGGAGRMLRSTDLPVSSIGYACGYLNNASFTRAFTRHFGIAPSHYRAHRIAA